MLLVAVTKRKRKRLDTKRQEFSSLYFCFFKDPRKKGKESPKGKAKKSLANTQIIASSKGKEPEDLGTEGPSIGTEGPSMTGVTTASRWVAIRHSGQNTQT